MTFAVVQHEADFSRKVVGMLWVSSESSAAAIAPYLFGSLDARRLQIVRSSEECEIPLKVNSGSGSQN